MAELAPMFRDPFYYQTERFGLLEGYVDADGIVFLGNATGYTLSHAVVRSALGGGYYARAIIGSLVFHVEGDTPGHAAADLMAKIKEQSAEIAKRAAMQEKAMG